MKCLGGLSVCVLALALAAPGCKKAKRSEQRAKSLETLGYLSSTPVGDNETALEGVTLLEPDAVSPGITSVCFLRSGGCVFIDMAGKVVHRLATPAPASSISPDGVRTRGEGTYVVRDYDETDLVALNGQLIQRIEWSGKVKWSVKPTDEFRFHHDLAVLENKDIVALYAGERWIDYKGAKLPILDDGLMRLRPDGTMEKLVSFYDVLEDKVPDSVLDGIKRLYDAKKLTKDGPSNPSAKYASVDGPTDLFHSNSVLIAPRDTPQWKKGDYILCLRHLNDSGAIVVLDHKTYKVVWSFDGNGLDHPHDPQVLPNGHVTLLDNGKNRNWSRVIEIDPSKNAIVNEYKSSKPLFLTHEAGGAQPLPNGNTLITESERGHLFEVTPAGKIVWEYFAPIVKVETGMFRDTVFRSSRATPGSPSTVRELQKLVDSVAGPGAPAMAAIHKAHPEQRGGRAWPVGREDKPRMSFVLSQTESGISYRATSGPIPAGEYRVILSSRDCSSEDRIADLGTFTSTGASVEWAFDGKLVGQPPEGGLASVVDRSYVAVTSKDGTETIACGRLFAL